jgi:Ala-tRNA(Pro) deacylase
VSEETVSKIRTFLDENGVPYEYKEHAEVKTSEEAAKMRGDDISIGAKALILKCDDRFVMCVLSASLKLDSKKLKQILGIKSLRFATPEEVLEQSGCLPGGVPPFASIFNLEMIVDPSVLANEFMAFNAGERTKSLKLKTRDYQRLLNPRVESFT